MARLTTRERKAMPHDKAHFLVPSKAPGPGSFPVPDRAHLKNAEARAVQTGRPSVAAEAKRRLHSGKGEMGVMGGGHHDPSHHSHGYSREMAMKNGPVKC